MIADIVLLPGDGIGPEITAQARLVLEASAAKHGHTFVMRELPMGGASIDAHGEPLTADTLNACRQADAVLLGAVGGPRWDAIDPAIRPERGLLALRKGMGVFANLRPCTIHPALAAACPLRPDLIAKPIDILVVRELTGDVYFGAHETAPDGQSASDVMVYTVAEIERVARVAFLLARGRGKRLCSVDKANVLAASRLWRETVTRLGAEYPDVELSHMYVDNAAMQLILKPAQFDVVVTGNLFGDILSDESAAIAGSLGMMPSASLGKGRAGLYEPIHGSAPDIAGRDLANPLGTILSAALLLRHSLGLEAEAAEIEAAVSGALNAGYRTGDIYSEGCQKVGCTEMGRRVIGALST
ncbi:MAG: 3-isopropylmalate dehydrogenase [Clostridia bacterium]|nr:3-isopropylmalate dehydrogenase [Clostridia bacterium]